MQKLLKTAIPLGMLMADEAFAEPMAISRNGNAPPLPVQPTPSPGRSP